MELFTVARGIAVALWSLRTCWVEAYLRRVLIVFQDIVYIETCCIDLEAARHNIHLATARRIMTTCRYVYTVEYKSRS